MPAKDSNRCIAAIGPSVFNPILHTMDRWFSVAGNQVLHKTVRFQGAVEHRISILRLQLAFISIYFYRGIVIQFSPGVLSTAIPFSVVMYVR
jgi:hypothetical protein